MLLSDVCLTSVCRVRYNGPKSRTERPRKTTTGTEIVHVTCDSDTTFRIKRSKSRSQGCFTYLTRKTAAAVSVGTYSAWESTATLHLLLAAREAIGRSRGMRAAGTYCVATRTACLITPYRSCPVMTWVVEWS